MTKNEIVGMARVAGGADVVVNSLPAWVGTDTTRFLERFAILVAGLVSNADRKACVELINKCAETNPDLAALVQKKGKR